MNQILGYKELSEQQVIEINCLKYLEKTLLRCINALETRVNVNTRWKAIAITNLEQGFMAAIRCICEEETKDET